MTDSKSYWIADTDGKGGAFSTFPRGEVIVSVAEFKGQMLVVTSYNLYRLVDDRLV